jgi:serine/threonine-protein kinase
VADNTDKLPKEGDVIANKYDVNEVLGRGGMGLVVAATHRQLEQRVAIKFLTAEADKDTKQRFNREARSAAKLKSEHVARVHDVGELDNGIPYMVMEYLQGADLGKIVKRRGALPVHEAVGYLLQACEAIAEAHSVGIVHRDLKPPNLFLAENPDGTVTLKVVDFGISKDRTVESLSRTEEDLTKTSMVLGTPHFMAPEHMRSAKDVDARADIWSLGAILYQLLTGKRPFRGPTFPELVIMVIQENPILPRQHRPDIPEEVEQAILKCLAKQPEDRFPNVADFCFAIAPYGPPQSFARAERMERTLGLAPLSSAPGSAPPPSVTAPGVRSSQRPNRRPASRAPVSRGTAGPRSWYPDTEQEIGDPTLPDPSLGLRREASAAISVDVVGLSAFDKTAVADPASLPDAAGEEISGIGTQMTAETSVPVHSTHRRKGPRVRTLGIVAAASVGLLITVAIVKPATRRARTVPAQQVEAPGDVSDTLASAPPPAQSTPPSADVVATPSPPPGNAQPSQPTSKPDREVTPDPEPQLEPEPDPQPEPAPVAPPPPKPAAPPPPRPAPIPKPPPKEAPKPAPPPKNNPLDMELK